LTLTTIKLQFHVTASFFVGLWSLLQQDCFLGEVYILWFFILLFWF